MPFNQLVLVGYSGFDADFSVYKQRRAVFVTQMKYFCYLMLINLPYYNKQDPLFFYILEARPVGVASLFLFSMDWETTWEVKNNDEFIEKDYT